MMKIKDFEKQIKQINQNLSIVAVQEDISGVYIEDKALHIALPPIGGKIYETKRKDYCDRYGHPHRTRKEAIQAIITKLTI